MSVTWRNMPGTGGRGGLTRSMPPVPWSAASCLRPSTSSDFARRVELDDHVGALVGGPDIVVLVDPHGMGEAEAIEIMADLADDICRWRRIPAAARRWSRKPGPGVAAAEDKDMALGIDGHAGGLAEIHAGGQVAEILEIVPLRRGASVVA